MVRRTLDLGVSRLEDAHGARTGAEANGARRNSKNLSSLHSPRTVRAVNVSPSKTIGHVDKARHAAWGSWRRGKRCLLDPRRIEATEELELKGVGSMPIARRLNT